jgi:hypothetical protein
MHHTNNESFTKPSVNACMKTHIFKFHINKTLIKFTHF